MWFSTFPTRLEQPAALKATSRVAKKSFPCGWIPGMRYKFEGTMTKRAIPENPQSEEIHLMHCIASDGQNGTIEELNELLSLQAAFQCKRCPMFNLWKSGVFPFFRLQVQDLTVICTHHNDCSSNHTVWVSKLIFKRWIWKRSMKST